MERDDAACIILITVHESGRMDVSMNSCELVSFVTAISCEIAKCVPKEELPLVAAVFGQIGATLATIAVQEDIGTQKKPTPEAVPESEIISRQTGISFK